MEEGWLEAGVAAELARAYAEHQREFLESLARLLENSLPGQVAVVRRGSLLSREKRVAELSVQLGDERYNEFPFKVWDKGDFFAPFASGSAGFRKIPHR